MSSKFVETMKQLIGLMVFAAASLAVNAGQQFEITGAVFDEKHAPLVGVSVSVQDKVRHTDSNGRYSIAVARADLYRLNVKQKGFYPSLQTFSHFELVTPSQTKLAPGDIELVEKVNGRTLLAFGGDVMMGRRYHKPYFDNPRLILEGQESQNTKAIVEHVRPYMAQADFAAVNLETQIASSEPERSAPKSVTFFSPPQTLSALKWAGIDYVTLGNNHTYDYMDSGLESTLVYLKDSGLAYSGAGLDQQQALSPYRVSLNNQRFSMLGYVGWEGNFSPNQTASYDKGGAAYGSISNITASVAKEAAANRATVVQYHGSQEYAPEPSLVTEQRLKSAIDSGADLAIGHHPHVSQGFEIYNGKLIAYSMGNFIFDQFFYSTPHSFILYVWMDGEKFHRAEIIPIYLKGYLPTPATGMHRYTVLKRLAQLSKKRGVEILSSGGHGVIASDKQNKMATPGELEITARDQGKIQSLYRADWSKELVNVSAQDDALRYRLGVNLVNGSDFESYDYFGSPERGWNIDQNSFDISEDKAYSGNHAMKTTLAPEASDTFAMTNFRRVYQAGNPMTVALRLNASQATRVRVYWQGRKTRDKFFDALNNGKKHLIHEINVTAGNEWQAIEVPFNSPRVGYKSIRIILEFENATNDSNRVFIDDLSLIEWQSSFIPVGKLPFNNALTSQASFIEFSRPLQSNEKVNLTYR